jgi:hypothetical protein
MLLYYGPLRIPVAKLFTVTGWMILLLAAGLAAQAWVSSPEGKSGADTG